MMIRNNIKGISYFHGPFVELPIEREKLKGMHCLDAYVSDV
jgi:hypothetical protein